MDERDLLNLGYENAWVRIPPRVAMCRELKHKLTTKRFGENLTKTICESCEYVYRTDSGD